MYNEFMEKYISQIELIKELGKSKIIANERLLISWRAWGAIPHRKRGLGRGKGSVTEYPAAVTQQIQRLLELLDEKRSLDFAIYQLWREGYPVNLRKVIKRDLRKIKDLQDALSKNAWYDGDGEQGGTNKKYGQKRLPRGGLLDRVRRTLGKEDFVFLVEALVIGFTALAYYKAEHISAFMELLPDQLDREGIAVALQHVASDMSIEHLEVTLNNALDADFPIAYNKLETGIDWLRVNYPLFGDIPPVSEWHGFMLSLGLLLCLSPFADRGFLEMYHLETVLPAEI